MEECIRARSAIEALIDGELGIAEEADLQTHLAGCPACSKEVEERRAFSANLGTRLRGAMAHARPSAEEKRALVDRLAAAPRRPGFQWMRLAATILVAATVAVAGYATGVFGPKSERRAEAQPLVKETAEMVARREAARARYEEMIREIERMTDDLRTQLPVENPTHAEQTAALELAALEDRICEVAWGDPLDVPGSDLPNRVDYLAKELGSDKALHRAAARRELRRLGVDALPYLELALQKASKNDRWFLSHLVRRLHQNQMPSNSVEYIEASGDSKIEFRQLSNAKVEIVVHHNGKQQTFQADSMRELQRKHSEVCKQFKISGRDGAIRIGEGELEAPFEDQLTLVFDRFEEEDFAPYRKNAYANLPQLREKDRKEVEKLVVNLEVRIQKARSRRAEVLKYDPALVAQQVQYLQTCDRTKLEEMRRQAERDYREMESKLQAAADLHGRLNALKVYVDEVKAQK